jgi:hypothetical protein
MCVSIGHTVQDQPQIASALPSLFSPFKRLPTFHISPGFTLLASSRILPGEEKVSFFGSSLLQPWLQERYVPGLAQFEAHVDPVVRRCVAGHDALSIGEEKKNIFRFPEAYHSLK